MHIIKLARRVALVGIAALTTHGSWLRAAERPREVSYRSDRGLIVIPASSQSRQEDAGVRAHTNVRILFPGYVRAGSSTPPPGFETPASLACIYGFAAPVTGCNPSNATALPIGGSKVVVIVDAYDDPTAAHDLGVYSAQFGLPEITGSNFEVVYASGKMPAQDPSGGWELEESLDIEMAHAMAPNAKVILVEAASQMNKDLLAAEAVAASLAAAAGGGEVSNSWGEGEFDGERLYENTFTGSNVVFVAASGDNPGTVWPSVLQNVASAGGTNIKRNKLGNYVSQGAWEGGGGGSSTQIDRPSYQSIVSKIEKTVGKFRGSPDLSFDADPNSGVVIYDTTPYGGTVLDWTAVGGTSVASPALAAAINSAGSFAASTSAELTASYTGYADAANWTDIRLHYCGSNGGAPAKKGYDFCTGIGVPNGYGGK